jgi:hypothetical protein
MVYRYLEEDLSTQREQRMWFMDEKIKTLREEIESQSFKHQEEWRNVVDYFETEIKLRHVLNDPIPPITKIDEVKKFLEGIKLTDEEKLEIIKKTKKWYEDHNYPLPQGFVDYAASLNGKNGKEPENQ